MTNQEVLLDTLSNVLVSLVTNAGGKTSKEEAYQYVQSFYAYLRFNERNNTNYVYWIKTLRDTFKVPEGKVVNLRYEPGDGMRKALTDNQVTLWRDQNELYRVYRFGYTALGLKETKDFVDFIIDCVEQITE